MRLILILIVVFSNSLFGQRHADNMFHTRSYWKSNPSLKQIKQDIKKGNDPVSYSEHYMDATSYAILMDADSEIINYLLSLDGNEVNKATHDGRNYVMWAAYKGNASLVKQLLDQNSDVTIIDDHGYNLLTFAALGGVADTVIYDMILAQGLDIQSRSRDGAHSLLLLCSSIKDTNVIRYFERKGLHLIDKDRYGNGAFHYAARKGNIDMMKMLVERGLDYKELNNLGENAVNIAANGTHRKSNGMDVFKYLDSLGLDFTLSSSDGSNPIIGLASNEDHRTIDYFINKGVDINAIDSDGNTFFHKTAARDNTKALARYISKAKDINAKNSQGYTPLTYALRRKSEQMVNTLMKNGASVEIIDNKGNNLVGHLFDSFDENEALFFYRFMDFLQNKGINVLKKQAGGNTIAHLSAEKLSPQLIQKAVALGAQLNTLNDEGYTPLHIVAAKASDAELLKIFIELGSDIALPTSYGETVLEIASENEVLKKNNVNLDFLK